LKIEDEGRSTTAILVRMNRKCTSIASPSSNALSRIAVSIQYHNSQQQQSKAKHNSRSTAIQYRNNIPYNLLVKENTQPKQYDY
jgi:hypothetical protein